MIRSFAGATLAGLMAAASTLCVASAQEIDRAAFDAWKQAFRAEALAEGVTAATYDAVMADVAPLVRVVELDRDQPEFTRALWDYLDSAVSERRIADGRRNHAANAELLEQIELGDGVDAELLVAIWGLESAYGAIQGGFDVFSALATIAFDGRREALGKSELIAAMKIVDRGYATRSELKGSWSGAMGQPQFLPTTYLDHAVDHDGDRRRDIWSNPADVMASMANYLRASGYDASRPWGVEARLPADFDYALADRSIEKAAAEWAGLGVAAGDGASLLSGVDPNARGFLMLPAGARGPAFLIFPNFRAILRYNNSTAYALAVGLLSDRIAGRSTGLSQGWPRGERPLTRSEIIALQEGLKAQGFDPGAVDGLMGPATRGALRGWQQARRLPADGFATTSILEAVTGS